MQSTPLKHEGKIYYVSEDAAQFYQRMKPNPPEGLSDPEQAQWICDNVDEEELFKYDWAHPKPDKLIHRQVVEACREARKNAREYAKLKVTRKELTIKKSSKYLRMVGWAARLYWSRHSKWPVSMGELVTPPSGEPILEEAVFDDWGQEIAITTSNFTIEIRSFGSEQDEAYDDAWMTIGPTDIENCRAWPIIEGVKNEYTDPYFSMIRAERFREALEPPHGPPDFASAFDKDVLRQSGCAQPDPEMPSQWGTLTTEYQEWADKKQKLLLSTSSHCKVGVPCGNGCVKSESECTYDTYIDLKRTCADKPCCNIGKRCGDACIASRKRCRKGRKKKKKVQRHSYQCPTTSSCGCSRYRKSECGGQCCSWTVGVGCGCR